MKLIPFNFYHSDSKQVYLIHFFQHQVSIEMILIIDICDLYGNLK